MPKNVHQTTYLLIDGNALVHRGFHAMPYLQTKTGQPTGGVYGFSSMLLRALTQFKPTHIICCFDLEGPTFRHEAYAEYKATRTKAPQELYDQFPLVKEILRALHIPIYEKAGFEADDIIGTLAKSLCEQNQNACDVIVLTADMDLLQLVNDCVRVASMKTGMSDLTLFTPAAVQAKYGFSPEQIIDYKALRGDASDNIPGVRGIGEKTATQLLQLFGSVKNIYQALEAQAATTDERILQVKPRTVELLRAGKSLAEQSYELATIHTAAPIGKMQIPQYVLTTEQLQNATQLFAQLEFKTLASKLPNQYVHGNSEKSNNVEFAQPISLETQSAGAYQNQEIDQLFDQTNKRTIAAVEATEQPAEIKFEKKPELYEVSKQEYALIDSAEAFEPVVQAIAAAGFVVLDTETTSLDSRTAELVGIALCIQAGHAWFVTKTIAQQNKMFTELLSDPNFKVIGHNLKFDLSVLRTHNLPIARLAFDTMVASYVLHAASRQHGLDTLVFNEFGYTMQPITDLIGSGKNQITMAEVDLEKVAWYAGEDVDFTYRLWKVLEPQLTAFELTEIFKRYDMPLVAVLCTMERTGVRLQSEVLTELNVQATEELESIEAKIFKLAGEVFNINSPKQLQVILFEKLGLQSGKRTKTGYSTAAGTLEKMRGEHEIVNLILEYRELSKLRSTYLEALPTAVAEDGRIHTSYNQTVTTTGRLSSTEPNLQNIPVRGSGLGSRVREAFVPSRGYALVAFDYSQIELRIAAHISGDERLKEIFQEGLDVHTATAAEIFQVPLNAVTKDMRRDAKAINFGILYGLTSFGLSSRVEGMSQYTAKDFIDQYMLTFTGLAAYMNETRLTVNSTGELRNMNGRLLQFPEIQSSQFMVRQAVERAAINFPIQSVNADIIKRAMIEIQALIERESTENCRMLLQVHDELVFEIKKSEVAAWVPQIKAHMETVQPLSVPVVVDVRYGKNWGELEEYTE